MIIDSQMLVVTPRQLELDRCPHCKVATPNLERFQGIATADSTGGNHRKWDFYHCSRCGGVVVAAWTEDPDGKSVRLEMYPGSEDIDASIDDMARYYLQHCKDNLPSPPAAVILAASAVDAMLKAKGYKVGKLYPRIKKAEADHIITADMATWAHQVRLDANDQRHADESASLPTREDAQRSLDFAMALAEILFVLPARVTRGLNESVN